MKSGRYKRPFDLAVIALAHLLLLPIWVGLWIFIPTVIWLTDRGPIFYRQRRVGRNGKEFNALKFRSMIPEAESVTGPIWSPENDSRVTTVGKFLRITALDELPQILNILKGDMSLVGPRSERPELHTQIVKEVPRFALRLEVRPGLTGLAQIRGEYDLSPVKKLTFDLEYISCMNLFTDSKIIIRSVWNSVTGRWDKKTSF